VSREADGRDDRETQASAGGREGAPSASGQGGSKTRIALGVTGGLVRAGAEVHVIMTPGGRRFITPLTLQTLSGQSVITGQWDLSHGADVQHIALARGLDLFLVAPATADTLAKLAHGIADDFLSTFYLAVTAPVAVAPAMNVWMWEHPATQANLSVLKSRGVRVIEPGTGDLACGDEGIGRMAEPDDIVNVALSIAKKKLRGRLRAAESS
jgi:phosphopantothenoylcysteine decarboxylase / phosphopantothenate---cysteine ligase